MVSFLQSTPLPFKTNVTPSAYGLETAFSATYSPTNSGPSIIFNAEYDALPNIGHACGHNLIAISSLTAFLSLCTLLHAANPPLPGQVTLLGCPAEEGGAGKVKLLEAGAYASADVVLMGHPGPENWQGVDATTGERYTGTAGQKTVSRAALVADFWGREAHAGGMPWEGVNALDAVVGAYNMVAMMRQQSRPEERIHACIWKSPVSLIYFLLLSIIFLFLRATENGATLSLVYVSHSKSLTLKTLSFSSFGKTSVAIRSNLLKHHSRIAKTTKNRVSGLNYYKYF